jgi:hypothetical protein
MRTRPRSATPACLAAALLLIAATLAPPAAATPGVGAGTSLGVGFTAYTPSPLAGPHVDIPALEIAGPLGDKQLRFRSPLLRTFYNAYLRHQFLLVIDAFLLWSPGTGPAAGKAGLQARLGPMVGVRINAGHDVFQPCLRVGARLGAELMGPQRGGGLFFGAEPLLELQGGSAGFGRQSLTFGGGVLFTIASTGYQKS